MTNQSGPNNTVVIHAVGDCGPRRVDYGEDPESLFAMVHKKIKEADISVCQLEEILSTRGCLQYRENPTWIGRVHPDNVKSLVFAGFDVVSNASNHCFDYGPEALLECIDVLRRNNLKVIGVGKDILEARQPAILERKGVKVGFLAYNSVAPPEYEAREGKPGCSAIHISTYYEAQEYQAGTPPKIITVAREEDVRAMEEDIRGLRRQVDVVVVVMHWGVHHIPGLIAMYQPAVGYRAIDAGADLIVGHHAHMIKGIEIYKNKVIFYSLGNFAEEVPWHLTPPPGVRALPSSAKYGRRSVQPGWERYQGEPEKRLSFMAKCTVRNKTIDRVSFLPAWINQKAEPEIVPATDERFGQVVKYMEPWCKELGTALRVEGDEVVVYPVQPGKT
ncbi:MAG: CapA family protein [Chloroflexi bacterium]|nr:CapA family protein [Chloroflexota bacterium]